MIPRFHRAVCGYFTLRGQLKPYGNSACCARAASGHELRAASFGRIADQPAGHDLLPSRIDRWYPQPRDMSDYPVTATEEIRVGCDEERRWSILRHGGKRRIDLLVVARRQQFQSQAGRASGRLQFAAVCIDIRIGRIE